MAFNKQIFNILTLKHLFNTQGDFHPAELVRYIMEFIIEPMFQIRCGLSHMTILQKTTGRVYTCGYDPSCYDGIGLPPILSHPRILQEMRGLVYMDGYIGDNKLHPTFFPKQIKEISCESCAIIAYAIDGTRYPIGDPEYERFFPSGDESKSKFNISTKYSHNKISRGMDVGLFLCADGKLCLTGNAQYSEENIKYPRLIELGLTKPYKVVQIGCPSRSIFVLIDCGHMYSWGLNNHGQLGLGDTTWRKVPTKINLNDVIAFSCGPHHTVVLDKSRNVWQWGCDHGVKRFKDTEDSENKHKTDILNPKRVLLDNVLQLCCGSEFTMALDLGGNVYSWGNNTKGELGLGDYDGTSKPCKLELEGVISVACGEHHVIALTLQNEIYVWGDNKFGQLGLGDHENRNSPQRLEFNF